jgi:mannose-6-phosphate isomerase-like protein (cupin superfamily)
VSDGRIVSRHSAEHYTWGEGCDGWHLVKTAALSIIEERMPPGTTEIRHVHARARQFFYVLEGTLALEVEGREHTLGAGDGLEIEPGQAHQAVNKGVVPVRFIVTSQPPSHGDRIAANSTLGSVNPIASP